MQTSIPNDLESMESSGIPVAQLPIISLARIRAKELLEISELERAASTQGFLFLDLRGDFEGERMLATAPRMYAVAKKYFSQSDEVKAKDVRTDIKPSQDLGWKKSGGAEGFEISRDEVVMSDASTSRLPQAFQDEWKKVTEFCADCDDVCLTLLHCLSTDFAEYHRTHQPSDTGLKLVLHPALAKSSDVGESLHTDSGTLTLLFYKDWSIHAFFPDAGMWAFIPPPIEGCVLINVANSLERMSGRKFRSPEHRVTQPFDGAKNRYYLSYYLRPETAVLERWNAEE